VASAMTDVVAVIAVKLGMDVMAWMAAVAPMALMTWMAPHKFPVEIASAGLVDGSAMVGMLAVLTVAAMAGNLHHTSALNAVQMLVVETGVVVAEAMRSALTVAVTVMIHVVVVAAANALRMARVVAVAAPVCGAVTVDMGVANALYMVDVVAVVVAVTA
jgi:hypothetical protein